VKLVNQRAKSGPSFYGLIYPQTVTMTSPVKPLVHYIIPLNNPRVKLMHYNKSFGLIKNQAQKIQLKREPLFRSRGWKQAIK